jgi:flagellar L-ring protein precursor FlgH
MKGGWFGAIRLAAPLATGLLFAVAAEAAGPSSSLLGNPELRRPLSVGEHSWTSGAYRLPQEVKQLEEHDLITVLVDEKSVVVSEGEMDRKKKAHGDLILKDWILLKGLAAIPDPQTLGEPHIRGEMDNKLRAEAGMETRDSMKFRITCQVAEILPNGNLVIEGHDTIRNNSEVWDYSLMGEIRPEDVLPNNTVLSEQVFNKRIDKRESGHVRDGYRRGWLLRWLDKWQPF